MGEQIPAEIIADRFRRLTELQNEHSLRSNQATVGHQFEVLIEGRSASDAAVLSGRTRCNRLVNLRVPDVSLLPDRWRDNQDHLNSEALEGQLAMVTITEAKTFSLLGELEYLIS